MRRYWFPLCLTLLLLLALPAFILFGMDVLGYSGQANTWLEKKIKVSHHTSLAPWASIILLLVPFILLLLYFLRLKRRPVAVPSTFLWKKTIEDLHVNRLLQWFRKNVLLLLQLLFVLMATYAALAPRLHGNQTTGKYYILIIDNSASMTATDVGPSRLEWAKTEALKEIDANSDSDIGMVIVFNSTAEILESYTQNRDLLRAAVRGIKPTVRPTQIDEALNLAASLANPLRSTENEAVRPDNPEPGKERTYAANEGIQADVHLYSDGRFQDASNFALTNLQLTFHAPPHDTPGDMNNVGLVRLDAFRNEADPNKVEVLARLLNFRAKETTINLVVDVMIDGKSLPDELMRQMRPVLVPKREYTDDVIDENGKVTTKGKDVPGETIFRFEFKGLEENKSYTFSASFDKHKDAYALDDRAWIVLGVVRKGKVLLVSPGLSVIDNFMKSKDIQRIIDYKSIPPADMKERAEYLDPISEGKYDLVIYDRCAPGSPSEMPKANTVFFGTPPPPWHVGGNADEYQVKPITFPRVLGWKDNDPITAGIRGWHELEIADAFRCENLPPRTPKLVEGEKDLALIFTLSRDSFKDVVVAFPIILDDGRWNTRWFKTPQFPYFLWNLLHVLGNIRDNVTEENLRPGMPKLFRPFGKETQLRLVNPDGSSRPVERGTRADFNVGNNEQLGEYFVDLKDQSFRFAVNLFDSNESHIEPKPTIQIGDSTVKKSDERRSTPMELWRYPLILGIIVIMIEWFVYIRRVKV